MLDQLVFLFLATAINQKTHLFIFTAGHVCAILVGPAESFHCDGHFLLAVCPLNSHTIFSQFWITSRRPFGGPLAQQIPRQSLTPMATITRAECPNRQLPFPSQIHQLRLLGNQRQIDLK